MCSLICEVAQVVVVVGKAVGQREVGQDRFVVDGICLDFVKDLHSVGQRFGYVGEEGVHLFGRFHPLLFGVQHAFGVVEVLAGGHTYKAVVGFGVFLVDEVHIVGGHDFYVVLARQLDKLLVDVLLNGIDLVICTRHCGFVALQFDVVVVAERVFEP